jgi:hypothetical protein
MVEVTGIPQTEARLRAIRPASSGLMPKLALAAVAEAKRIVPRKTGTLGRSIHVGAITPTTALITASANYAAYVEFGTRPHEITPKARKALRFAASSGGARLSGTPRSGADVVFAKRVHHPGTKPQPFLLKGAEQAVAGSDLAGLIVAEWNRA